MTVEVCSRCFPFDIARLSARSGHVCDCDEDIEVGFELSEAVFDVPSRERGWSTFSDGVEASPWPFSANCLLSNSLRTRSSKESPASLSSSQSVTFVSGVVTGGE